MKNHFGKWSNDYRFARVECGTQGHGKSTSPSNLITDLDAFFYLSEAGEETCAFCFKKAIAKTPKRYARVVAMYHAGATLDEIRADTAKRKAEKAAA